MAAKNTATAWARAVNMYWHSRRGLLRLAGKFQTLNNKLATICGFAVFFSWRLWITQRFPSVKQAQGPLGYEKPFQQSAVKCACATYDMQHDPSTHEWI